MDDKLNCKSNKTKWNKPNVTPDDSRDIILKVNCPCQESCLIGGFYKDDSKAYYCTYIGNQIDVEEIIGWCETIK